MCEKAVEEKPYTLEFVPDQFEMQEMCKKVIEENPWCLKGIPDHFKTQGMCKKVIDEKPYTLEFVPDLFKTQEMCKEAVEKYLWQLDGIPDYLKTQEMCDKAVRDHYFSLQYVSNWFVTQQQVKLWHDDDEVIEWYEGHQKRKTQKAQIKEELMPIAWHPSRRWDWCVPEYKKKDTEKSFLTILYAEPKNVYNKRRCLNLVR